MADITEIKAKISIDTTDLEKALELLQKFNNELEMSAYGVGKLKEKMKEEFCYADTESD